MSDSIKLILISGFLGSGKTTFLNNIFKIMPDVKFGIIVNDFGSIGVDSKLLGAQDKDSILELNNGQIFCSCLAGSFVSAVGSFSRFDIDYLLVETSGLAKPSPLLEIINEAKAVSNGRIKYHGMISLVDASTYRRLSQAVLAVNEQIAYSNKVILNKTDLAGKMETSLCESDVLTVNPEADIIRTSFGEADSSLLEQMPEIETVKPFERRFAGWGRQGRPVPVLLTCSSTADEKDLNRFIDSIRSSVYRIKGWLKSEDGYLQADISVASDGQYCRHVSGSEREGLVIISPADDTVLELIKKSAEELSGAEIKI